MPIITWRNFRPPKEKIVIEMNTFFKKKFQIRKKRAMRYLPKGQQRGRRVQLAAGVSHISLRYNYCGISRNTSTALENCVIRSQQLLQWNRYVYKKLAYLVIIVKIVYSAFSTNIFLLMLLHINCSTAPGIQDEPTCLPLTDAAIKQRSP